MLRIACAIAARSRASNLYKLSSKNELLNKQRALWFHTNKTERNKFESTDRTEIKQVENKGQTPDDPILVASPTEKCIVGCTCSPNSSTVNWFYVNEGDPQTCGCGYYFQLVKVDPKVETIPEYSRIMYVDDKAEDPRRQNRGPSFLKKIFSKASRTVTPPSSMRTISNEKNKPE